MSCFILLASIRIMIENIWGYEPIVPLAVAAAAVFGLGAAIHLIQAIYYRTKFFVAFIVGAFMMTLGYVLRTLSVLHPNNIALYALQNIFILLPPSLYAATLYMTYSRLVVLVDEPQASILRPQMVTNFFVCIDMFSFLATAGGGARISVEEMAPTGKKLEILGLALQLLSFCLFLAIAIVFRIRIRKTVTEAATKKHGRYSWKTLHSLLMAAAVLIIIRATYRIIEFSETEVFVGTLMRREGYAYVLDAVPMFVLQTMFSVVHAGQVLPRKGEGREKIEGYLGITADR
ncbi:RTA1 like protein [Aureobasidium pullulans]|nr:RTA1 like protein [Aureobasidium pullulans]